MYIEIYHYRSTTIIYRINRIYNSIQDFNTNITNILYKNTNNI